MIDNNDDGSNSSTDAGYFSMLPSNSNSVNHTPNFGTVNQHASLRYDGDVNHEQYHSIIKRNININRPESPIENRNNRRILEDSENKRVTQIEDGYLDDDGDYDDIYQRYLEMIDSQNLKHSKHIKDELQAKNREHKRIKVNKEAEKQFDSDNESKKNTREKVNQTKPPKYPWIDKNLSN